jgi:hypothetical protein
LTITGEAASPSFYRLINRDPPSLVEASALTRVYATAGQARRAFKRQARRRTHFLERGRSLTILELFALNGPPDLEQNLVSTLAARLR